MESQRQTRRRPSTHTTYQPDYAEGFKAHEEGAMFRVGESLAWRQGWFEADIQEDERNAAL